MVLPKPTISFTIPSIYDDTVLDCRLYYPLSTEDGAWTGTNSTARVAVIAHPYAPLGGCYDDFVVVECTRTLLKAGWSVITFNFRGAAQSKGRTSWNGKPELDDFSSVAGLACIYLDAVSGSLDVSPIEQTSSRGQLLLAGYSYGSLILQHLPSVADIKRRLESSAQGSAAAEIRLRATHLSTEMKSLVDAHKVSRSDNKQASPVKQRQSAGANLSVTMGGEETPSPQRRSSREHHRVSLDALPAKIRDLSNRRKLHERTGSKTTNDNPVSSATNTPQVSYMIISPLLPPLSLALAIGLRHRTGTRKEEEDQLATHPTICFFGDHDAFTSANKLTAWTENLHATNEAFFIREVEAAGHFWHEPGVMEFLRKELLSWLHNVRSLHIS